MTRAGLLLAAGLALLAGPAAAEPAPSDLRPVARPAAEAPIRPLARGQHVVARLAVMVQRPQARALAAGIEQGEPLRKAWMPPLPQDKGDALAAGGALAVPPGLLVGRVSTMNRSVAGTTHAERALDRLFSSPIAMPQPAVWRGPVPPVRHAVAPVPPLRPQARTASVAAWAAAVQVPVIDTRNAPAHVLVTLSPLAVAEAVRPGARQADFQVIVAAATVSATPRGTAPALSQGSGLCGVPVLSGRALGSVPGRGPVVSRMRSR